MRKDAALDGLFILTKHRSAAADVARTYKSLWRAARTFLERESTLDVRPIHHHSDRGPVGHIVASFLALRLEVDLQRRLEEQGVDVAWPDVMHDLAELQAATVDLDGQRYRFFAPTSRARRTQPSPPRGYACPRP